MNESLPEAITYAKKYIEDLLSFFGLNTDVHATSQDDEVIELDVATSYLNGFLIGRAGETVRALQYMIGAALKSQNFKYTRVNVDIAGYKQQQAERLLARAQSWFDEVKKSGHAKELVPMDPAARRVIHQAAGEQGLATESVGQGRDRHIVLKPLV